MAEGVGAGQGRGTPWRFGDPAHPGSREARLETPTPFPLGCPSLFSDNSERQNLAGLLVVTLLCRPKRPAGAQGSCSGPGTMKKYELQIPEDPSNS